MADCKDDWIETGSRLSEEGWKLRRQRSDQRPVSETGDHHDHRIRSPFIKKDNSNIERCDNLLS